MRELVSMEPQIGIRGRASARTGDWRLTIVSMEPQIGIRGRDKLATERGTGGFVSMEPQIGIRGRKVGDKLETYKRSRFNGAPDRNPGKVRSRSGVIPSPTGFNGAPDRNPGKGRRLRSGGPRHYAFQWSPR